MSKKPADALKDSDELILEVLTLKNMSTYFLEMHKRRTAERGECPYEEIKFQSFMREMGLKY